MPIESARLFCIFILALVGMVLSHGSRAEEDEVISRGEIAARGAITTIGVKYSILHDAEPQSVAIQPNGRLSVKWLGEMAIGTGDAYFHDVGWIPTIEVGVRDDGVVVWRQKVKE